MGNHKFRLTDMIPNAWLYKLKDMRRRGSRKQSTTPTKRRSLQSSPRPLPSPKAANKLVPNRASYYISSRTDAEKWYAPSVDGGHCKASDAQLILDTPRRSKRMSRVKPITTRASANTAAAAAGCGCRSWKTESIPEFGLPASPESPSCQRDYYIDGEAPPPVLHKTNASNPCGCKISSSPADIIIDVSCKKSPEKHKELTLPESDVELPPILTKPAKKEFGPVKFEDEDVDVDAKGKGKCHIVGAAPVKAKSSRIQEKRSSSASSPAGPYRLRMRANSPRLAGKKALQCPRRGRKGAPSAPLPAAAMHDRNGFSKSFAVVKTSSDPQRDFRESMLEMIMELDMRTSKDLEDLLVCYLLLNSGEYHDVIVEAFQQIWLDLTDIN